MDLVPGTHVERYVVESRIGSGRMSTTYRVRHITLNTLHALTVPNDGSRALRRRMVAGARIQAGMRHPNVIAATDVLDLEGSPALVLDHVEGPTLGDFIQSNELDERSIDAIVNGLFEAVSFIHNNGIVHRHIKDRTVMIDLGREVAMPRLTDFTLAKVMGQSERPRKKVRVFGTPQFMSPEQTYDSDAVDHRADLWSLGCLLYYIVTGEHPFAVQSHEDVFTQVRQGRYTPVKKLVPSAPKRWIRAIEEALQVDLEDRVSSVADLADHWFAGSTERPAMVAKMPPVGKIALVFTDIQGSTTIWEHAEDLARHSLRAHDAVMRACLHRHGGYEVKTEGDAFMVAFKNPARAVRFCFDVQKELQEHPWSDDLLAMPEAKIEPGFRGLRVRMGVHVGQAEARARGSQMDYFGPFVNRAARIASAGHGGQILVSKTCWDIAESKVEDHDVKPLGVFRLRGIVDEQEILQVLPQDLKERTFLPVKAKSLTPPAQSPSGDSRAST